MPHAAYPTASDLEAFLIAAGFDATFVATLDLTTAAAAGQQAFEEATGRRFLATTQTREFDPCRVTPAGKLNLKTEAVSFSSVTWGTTTLTAGTDYRGLPLNAPDDGKPYNMLEFGHYRRYYPLTFPLSTLITVVGSWGYGTTIPDAVWAAMLAAAGLWLWPQIMQAITGGLTAWTEADMSETYGQTAFLRLQNGWNGLVYGMPGGPGQPMMPGAVQLWRRVAIFP